jgi:5-formyltetrahydrofolate cyclo-ligase
MAVPSKTDLRREMRRRIDALPPGQLTREGMDAGRHLVAAPCWGEYQRVLLFLSNFREIDTAPLLEAALSQGKTVFAPKVEGEELRFYRVRDAKGPWEKGPFGIREPASWEPVGGDLGPGDFPALIVLPGIAFDRAGRRLGHGKGFYDRFLATAPGSCLRVGFCAAFQVAPEIPLESWDQRVDALCTGQGFTPIAKKPRGGVDYEEGVYHGKDKERVGNRAGTNRIGKER